ncbi:hypothetical protein chiPu_0024607, partial [Chiloscyllium punctatum]|nr:hypothetical protein [Chiloscyllium punctatum]
MFWGVTVAAVSLDSVATGATVKMTMSVPQDNMAVTPMPDVGTSLAPISASATRDSMETVSPAS